mmetsp:Transcript_11583/g.43496  ORF Transcript_11583/g.43496 Transcript_11583/m.43496 type:complete len:727 (-) Transcript_11583:2097-4277(-)
MFASTSSIVRHQFVTKCAATRLNVGHRRLFFTRGGLFHNNLNQESSSNTSNRSFSTYSIQYSNPKELLQFPPSQHVLSKKPHIPSEDAYKKLYQESIQNPTKFWHREAENFHWNRKFDPQDAKNNFDVRKGPIKVQYFRGGLTNLSYNCLDRHVLDGKGSKVAIHWEGNEPGEQATFTYSDLLTRVCKMANVLRASGVKRGDTVTIYLPMTPVAHVTALACARIGAIHNIVFDGFSANSLAMRILDAKSHVVITADGSKRGKKMIPLKKIVDEAIRICANEEGWDVKTCLVHKRLGEEAQGKISVPVRKIDVDLDELLERASDRAPVEWMESEDTLFMIYTSGSTGKPKGIQHTTGGYMVYAGSTFKYTFDYHEDDVFFCTASVGWITGTSHGVYGPMLNGATQVVYEGIPTYPDASRFWQIVEKYKVNIFYTAPTALRSLEAYGLDHVRKHNLDSLRILGSVGECIDKSTWLWYYKNIGQERCAVVDTWWMSETGSFMLTPLPVFTLEPSSVIAPFFGIEPRLLSDEGHDITDKEGDIVGHLCVRAPWPGIARTLKDDHKRYEEVYFSRFPGYFYSGDLAKRSAEGKWSMRGRSDSQFQVSGHRIESSEIESTINSHPDVNECAIVSIPHKIKGEAIYAFVKLNAGAKYNDETKKSIMEWVNEKFSPIGRPEVIHWASCGLPRTRSGKYVRRVLSMIAKGETEYGDTSTISDESVIEEIVKQKGK